VNENSARPSVSSPPAAAADAAVGRRSQSASPSDDDYLVPKQNFTQPMYLDFPDAEPGNSVFYRGGWSVGIGNLLLMPT